MIKEFEKIECDIVREIEIKKLSESTKFHMIYKIKIKRFRKKSNYNS